MLTPLTNHIEQPLKIDCNGQSLPGILHRPKSEREGEGAVKNSGIAVLLIVGGPQYRVGSHRQFVLLARQLAANGIACLRFDYRGMGDSVVGDGERCDFSVAGDDIRAAADALLSACPDNPKLVLWGLCDAASAAMMYADSDDRLAGLILLNPWVRSEASMAKAYLRNYYLQRLTSPDLYKKLLRGGFDWRGSLGTLSKVLKAGRGSAAGRDDKTETPNGDANNSEAEQAGGGRDSVLQNSGLPASSAPPAKDAQFLDKMLAGWKGFAGPSLVILSGKGRDFVADEFRTLAVGRGSNKAWRRLLTRKNVQLREFPNADHTFSTAELRATVEQACEQWLLAKLSDS